MAILLRYGSRTFQPWRVTENASRPVEQPPQDPVGLVRQYRAEYYSPRFRQVTAAEVAALHQAGIPIVPWTVNEEREMRRLMRLGIGTVPGDGIATDFPDRLVNLVKARR